MTTGEKIKKARLEKGMTQEELGKKIGVKKAAINKYETGIVVNLKRSTIANLAEALDVDPVWLLGMEDQKALPKEIIYMSGLPHNRVPILGAIQCGLPTLAEENIEEYANVADLRCDFALRCVGDSMAPTLLDGDLVLLRSQPDVTDGQIAAIRIGEEATLKHLRHTPTGIILIPENPDYPPLTYELTEESDIAVIGLAIGLQRIIGRKS